MYQETHPVRFDGGIHNGTLDALRQFSPHGLTINGLDPGDMNTWDELLRKHRDPQSQVQIGVNHPDPQTARDIAVIAKHTMWMGRNLWPGRDLPPERFNQGANYLREHEGLPPELPQQAVASATRKDDDSALVSGDMTVISKWNVVALGELQQPGGVGATQDYNEVVDGPNPDGPNFGDNAGNSPEQEVATQTWVNMTVDMLNRGESPEAIVATLAHDGCPNPQEVLQRAQQQPEGAPVSDEIGQDPFKAPPQQDPTGTGEMQGLTQQPAVQAKVRIAGTTMTGTQTEAWESMWGEHTVRIALDGGGTLDVSPTAVEQIEVGATDKHPVTEIQQFIDSMPKVEPSRPHIEARLANLELVRRAVRGNISKVAFSDQVRLQSMDSAAEAETAILNEILSNHAEGFEIAYAKAQPRFKFNAFATATPDIQPWDGRAREAGAIWSVENFDSVIDDGDSFKAAAAHYASNLGLTGSQFQEFLAGAEDHRLVRTEEFMASEPETADNEGPAEELFG